MSCLGYPAPRVFVVSALRASERMDVGPSVKPNGLRGHQRAPKSRARRSSAPRCSAFSSAGGHACRAIDRLVFAAANRLVPRPEAGSRADRPIAVNRKQPTTMSRAQSGVLVTDYRGPDHEVERGVLEAIGAEVIERPGPEGATLRDLASRATEWRVVRRADQPRSGRIFDTWRFFRGDRTSSGARRSASDGSRRCAVSTRSLRACSRRRSRWDPRSQRRR